MELRHRVMLAYINGRQQGLPARYQKVAYLESTGVQYINTGIIPSNNLVVEVKFENKSSTYAFTRMVVVGTRPNTSSYLNIPQYYDNAGYGQHGLSVLVGVQSIYHALDFALTPEQTFNKILNVKTTLNNGSMTSVLSGYQTEDITKTGTYETSQIANTSLYAFATHYSDSSSYYFIGRIYNLKINNHQFVPCYDTENGNKPGMYDLVSRQFLVNQGTGADFIVGPDVHDLPAEFQEVESLTASRNCYIDLGFTANQICPCIVKTKACWYSMSNAVIFGNKLGTSRFDFGSNDSKFRLSSLNSLTDIIVNDLYDLEVKFENGNSYIKANGTTVITQTIEGINNDNNVYMFARKNENQVDSYFYGTIKAFLITDLTGNTKKHHYIPCYNKTTLVAGMYDLITKQFKTNSGTGSFIVGPDIN